MRHLVVAVCFFLSGGSGLVFESLWTRKLTQVFDSTTLGISSVLTAFMAGLALGSFVLGRRYADRVERPIVWYGVMEGAVGLWGLLVPFVIETVYPELNRFLWNHFEPGYFAFSFLRFVFVLALLLVPTTLMGATLPFLSRYFVRTEEEMRHVGRRVGFLYTLNTLGAVLGTFVAGYVLMPSLGFTWTNRMASFTNLLLCGAIVVVFVVFGRRIGEAAPAGALGRESPAGAAAGAEPARAASARADDADPDAAGAAIDAPADDLVAGARARMTALVAFGVSGFAAMNYQVAWNRVLAMVIGGSIYSFTTILLTFLIGIALGASLAAALVRRIRNPVFWLAVVQLWIGVASAAGYYFADDYPWLFAWLVDALADSSGGVSETLVLWIGFGVAALALLPSTLGMGATMPLSVRACATTRDRVGHDVGTIYAVNTVGAIVGSFLSAFVLLPALSRLSYWMFGAGYGLQLLIGLSIFTNFGVALALLIVMPTRRRREAARDARAEVFRYASVPFVAALAIVLALLTAVRGWTWDTDRLVAGSFRLAYLDSILEGERRSEMLYFYDGMSTTVTVQRWGEHLALKNNGKVDASTGDDMPTQVMVSGFPLLLHPRGPQGLRVAAIGFGSGVSVGVALRFPVARVDAVELEPAVVESSYYFRDENFLEYGSPDGDEPGELRTDDRLRIFSNDGRNYLASTLERYDVVISEPSNPWISGVSNLFTLEHFLAARQALAPGGLFCQWVQLYEMSDASVRSIVRTFAEAFAHVRVFAAAVRSSDIIMIGSADPIEIDIRRIRRAMADARTAQALTEARSDISAPDDILARTILASRDEVMAFAGDATINTDDNAYIEFRAPRDLVRFGRSDAPIVRRIYAPDWDWGKPDLKSLRLAGYDLSGDGTVTQIHAVTEALVRGARSAWAADLLIEAALETWPDLVPDRDAADDFVRTLRAGSDRSARRPGAPVLDALEAVVRRGSLDREFAADVSAAVEAYRSTPPRPAAASWLLARAAARARAPGVDLPGWTAFLLEAARECLRDEAVLEGMPIAAGLPDEWKPLVSEVTDPAVRRAASRAVDLGIAFPFDPADQGPDRDARSAVAAVLLDAATRFERSPHERIIGPDADRHVLRLLFQYVLTGIERRVAAGGTDPGASGALEAKRWRTAYEGLFDAWADVGPAAKLPELVLFDHAVEHDESAGWTATGKLRSYGTVARTRIDLLEQGDAWMEAHGVAVPSAAAMAPVLGEAGAARYAEFEEALGATNALDAESAWAATREAAEADGLGEPLEAAMPAAVAALAIGAARVRAGDQDGAWGVLGPLLRDAALRRERPEIAYWAARALCGSRASLPRDRLEFAGEDELRQDLLMAMQLMDRWAMSGGNGPQRVLLDGVPALEAAPPGGALYVPLVTEGWLGDWLEGAEIADAVDRPGIAGAAASGDDALLDRLIERAVDRITAARPPPTGDAAAEETTPISDDPVLADFAALDGGLEALVLFDSLVTEAGRESSGFAASFRGGPGGSEARSAEQPPRADDAPAGRGQIVAVLRRLASAPRLPEGLDRLRASVAFRYFAAVVLAESGDPAALAGLLGPALPKPPADSAIAALLDACPAARYHLARLAGRCGPAGCRLPVERDLHAALELAADALRPPTVCDWQADYAGPYPRVETLLLDMGVLVVRGDS